MSTHESKPLRVLYLHHYAALGGASRSMLEMIQSFTPEEILPRVVTPRGQFGSILRRAGVPVLESRGVALFDHTRYGRYAGWRWLIVLRELARLPTTVTSLLRARRTWPDIDVVHVNEATMLPSVILANWLLRRPMVVHVRSVMCADPGWRARLLEWILWRKGAEIVAIDESVRSSLPATRPVHVIHNGLRLGAQFPAATREGSLPARRFTVAMVGNLLKVKGCLDFVEAAVLCKQRDLPIDFVFVGQSARRAEGLQHQIAKWLGLSQEIEPELRARIEQSGLQDMVRFAGFAENLEAVYRSIDVVCFPSHFDAPGRPIFEAALYGVPSIAAITRPLPDTIVSEVTGLTVKPRDPVQLAQAIERLYVDSSLRARLGSCAREFALTRFDARANARQMLAVYRALTQAK